MANGGMSKEQLDALFKAYDDLQTNRAWRNREDYDRSLMRSMQEELEHYWEFQKWLRFVHPEVINEWQALQKVKGE